VSDLGVYHYVDRQTQSQVYSRSRRVTLTICSISENRAILNPLRYPIYSFCIFSHKIIRWLLAFWLLGMVATSAVLTLSNDFAPHAHILYAHLVFYALALIGILAARTRLRKISVLSVPMAICPVSMAYLKGVLRFTAADPPTS